MAEKGKIPVYEFGLRERFRGAMIEHPSGQPPENSWAAGYIAGARVALACAEEALAHHHDPNPLDPDSWAGGRARGRAMRPRAMMGGDLKPEEAEGPIVAPKVESGLDS